MSKQEEEFKKSLDNILNSKEFVFDEANWQDARKLIDDKRRRRRVLYFIWPLGLLILGGALFYMNSGNDNLKTIALTKTEAKDKVTPSSLPHLKETVIDTKKTSEKIPLQNVEQPVENIPANSPAKPTASQPIESKPKNEALPTTSTLREPTKQLTKKSNVQLPPVVSTNSAEPVAPEPASKTATAKLVKQKPKKSEDQLSPIVATNSTNPITSESKSKIDLGLTSKNAPQSNEDATAEPPLVNHPTVKKDVQPTSKAVDSKKAALENTTKQFGDEPAINTAAPNLALPSETIAALTADTNTAKKQADDSASEPIVQTPSVAATPAMIDTVLLKQQKPDSASAQRMPVKTQTSAYSLIAELGFNYTPGWNYKNQTDARGFTPLPGLHLVTTLTQKISASVGAQYSALTNLSYSSRVSQVTRFRFAEESDITIITPVSSHYFILPLKVMYHFTPNDVFGLGYNQGFLVNVNAQVETYHQGIKNEKENYQKTKSMGYTEGFNKYDSQLAVFYRRRIKGNFWANAEFIFGFSDLKDNAFFKTQVFERSTAMRLSLMYNFAIGKTR